MGNLQGASKSEEYGTYYAWGETSPRDYYYWDVYKWCKSSRNKLTKYCTDSSYGNNGFTDNLTELEPEDDAAVVSWGGSWRIPTSADFSELLDNTTSEWTTLNEVHGRKFTASNGNTIFLPASGHRGHSSTYKDEQSGFYWLSTLYKSCPFDAVGIYFTSHLISSRVDNRYFGRNIRPVVNKSVFSSEINATNCENLNNYYWYAIDGRKSVNEPTKKGMYIYKGRKVVK